MRILAAWLVLGRRRSAYLRERFGPEHERAVQQIGDRRCAETELERREKRVEQLQIRPLPLSEAQRFADAWRKVQTRFVDEPRQAVEQADKLVAQIIKRLAEIFADERSRLEGQWAQGGDVSTEDLRVALQRYRSLFDRLLSV